MISKYVGVSLMHFLPNSITGVYNEMESKRESITHDLMKQFFYPEERPEDISDDMAEEMMQKRFKT